ncbi:MAG: hypothetical protein Q8R98_17135 [Rubrivivax sp.]|nr:hypothetical protein [Rubrivivax sp.]MDP3613563.1 hypothetical protein [Rubrivivax sp.]
MKTTDFNNGHKEVVIWTETPKPLATLERAIDRDLGPSLDPLTPEQKAINVERAVRRAKQGVRKLAKAMIVNSLWTLTYRDNEQDRAQVMRDLRAFRDRTRAVLGEWKYIAVLERQERGAYHIHLATHALPTRLASGGVKVKSWDVMRAIWRSVTGERGGNFDEAKRSKRWSPGQHKPVRGAGAIARYIAGYVAKDMHESPENKKRYSHTLGVDMPAPLKEAWEADEVTMLELMQLAFSRVGQRITSAWFDAERGLFFVESDDSVPVG